MSELAGKVIVTSGGTQGVGEAVALHAARHGAAGVVVTGRQVERGRAVVAQVEELGSAGLFVRADLANVDDCRAVIHEADAQFGRVDGLVNAAADTNRGTIQDTTVEKWRQHSVRDQKRLVVVVLTEMETQRIIKGEVKGYPQHQGIGPSHRVLCEAGTRLD